MTRPGPGKLISLRGREWIVLPSADDDVLMVKPLDGSDDEVTVILSHLIISKFVDHLPLYRQVRQFKSHL